VGGAKVPLLLDAGTDNEEIVLMNLNTVATGVLTIDAPGLVHNHSGLQLTPVCTTLTSVSPGSEVLFVASVDNIPATGFLKIVEDGGATSEVVEFIYVDFLAKQIYLKAPLANVYAAATVNLLTVGCTVQVAQVLVQGVGWDIFQTDVNHLQILIPKIVMPTRLLDASYLHTASPVAVPLDVLAVQATAGDQFLELVDLSDFPDSGIIVLEAGGGNEEFTTYTRCERYTAKLHSTGLPIGGVAPTGTPIGVLTLCVDDVTQLYEAFTVYHLTTAVINRAGGALSETVTIVSIDVENSTVTLSAVTTKAHAAYVTIELGNVNKCWLTHPLSLTHLIGTTANFFTVPYAGVSVEDGRIFTADDARFQGHYVYDVTRDCGFNAETTLDEEIAGPQNLLVTQDAGYQVLEVADASRFDQVTLQNVRVGRGIAGDEVLGIKSIVLKRDIVGVKLAGGPYAVGATAITITAGSGLPDDPDDLLGYRLMIGREGAAALSQEEVVWVKYFDTATNILTIADGLQFAHTAAGAKDSVTALADFIKVDTTTSEHRGHFHDSNRTRLIPGLGTDWATATAAASSQNTRVSIVEEVRDYIRVAAHALFAGVDGAILNFGDKLVPVESQLVASEIVGALFVTVKDSSLFPAIDFYVKIGKLDRFSETLFVATNIANVLTFGGGDALSFAHPADEWVETIVGGEESVSLASASGNTLYFPDGYRFTKDHAKGEKVTPIYQKAIPASTGKDYPFLLTMTILERYQWLFDLVRAAGVQVTIKEI
jgi:hypothetical protein